MSSKDAGLIALLALALGAGAGLFASGFFRKKEENGGIQPYVPPPTPPILLLPPSGITAADLAASEARSAEAFAGLEGALANLGGALTGTVNGSTKSGRDSASKIRRARAIQAQIPDIQGALADLSGEFRAMDVGLQETLAESKAHRRRAISSIAESRTQIVANLAARSRALSGLERQGASIRRLVGGIR